MHTYGFSPRKGAEGSENKFGFCSLPVCRLSTDGELSCLSRTLNQKHRDVKEHTGVNPHMVLVVGGTGEGASAGWLRAVVRPLTSVCSDVNFSDIGGGERPATAFNWAFKRLLS